MMKKDITVGFIGLGKMGSGIAANIQKAGYDLMVFNRTQSKTRPFVERGAVVANSIGELVSKSDVVFTSVLDDKSLFDICHSHEGVLASMKPGAIHISLTTIQPSTADELKLAHEKHDCHYIAAPVVGRPDAAAAGKLITFLAGNQSVIESISPVIETYTSKQISTGNVSSSANAMKICVNYMAMSQLSMLGEIFSYAEKSQLDTKQVQAVAKMFFAGNEAMSGYVDKIATRDFDSVGFDLTAGLKDALIFEAAFMACGIKPSAINAAKDNLVSANVNGLGHKDWSALTEITRMLAGLKL